MRYLFLFFFVFTNLFANSQVKGKSYILVYDQNWNPCTPDTATYLAFVEKQNDTTWQWNYYNYKGPLLLVESYKDENATIPNGYFGFFNKKGKIDSAGYATNGKRNGKWYFYGDSTRPQLTKEYSMGILFHEEKAEKHPDHTLKPGEKEADFPGGVKKWVDYIQRNLDVPERANNLKINGTVLINFVVSSTGKVETPSIIQSLEYSIDREAIRLIRASPAWIPAEQEGKKVKAYRIQPITIVTQ